MRRGLEFPLLERETPLVFVRSVRNVYRFNFILQKYAAQRGAFSSLLPQSRPPFLSSILRSHEGIPIRDRTIDERVSRIYRALRRYRDSQLRMLSRSRSPRCFFRARHRETMKHPRSTRTFRGSSKTYSFLLPSSADRYL